MKRPTFRILSCSCILALILSCVVTAGASEITLNASIDNASKKVTVTGVAADTRARFIVVTVLKPSQTGHTLETITNQMSEMEYMSLVYTTDQVRLEDDNSFTYSFTMNATDEQGWYGVYLSGNGLNSLQGRLTQFYNANDYLIRQAVDQLNGTISGDLESLLTQVGILVGDDYMAVGERTKALFTQIRDEMKGFDTTLEISAMIEQVKQVFTEAKALALMDTANASNVTNIMKTYQSYLGLDLSGDFDSVSDSIGTLFLTIKTTDKITISKKADVHGVFEKSLALAVLNQSDRMSINDVLVKYNNIFKLDLTGNYAKVDQLSVAKALAFANFQSIFELQKAFDDKVGQLYLELSAPQKPTSSGGGGGGGSTYTVEMPVVVPVVTPAPAAEASLFDDLEDVSWAKESILAFSKEGFVSGVGDRRFMPNQTITREEFVKLIVMALKLDDTDITAVDGFSDITQNDWYFEYILIAKKLGIVTGRENGSFGVGESITRQDLAVLCYRAASSANISLPKTNDKIIFDDHEQISKYAEIAVEALNQAGIINGMGNNRFEPSGSASRAQAVKILYMMREYAK